MTYLWKKPDWPAFSWRRADLLETLAKARFEQGQLLALASPFVHSYELSEVKKAIYLDFSKSAFNTDRLLGWQASLFPTGYSGVKKISIAKFRTKDISDPPCIDADQIENQLNQFLAWFNDTPVELDPVLKAAITFLWFSYLSPFEAGNFDLAAAMTELSLFKDENKDGRVYDISLALLENQELIINKITRLSRENGDITDWLLYFIELHLIAVRAAYNIADRDLRSKIFWQKNSELELNARQRKVLNFALEQSESITNRLYVEITKTSRESAKRDLKELVRLGLLVMGSSGGRSRDYHLASASLR